MDFSNTFKLIKFKIVSSNFLCQYLLHTSFYLLNCNNLEL